MNLTQAQRGCLRSLARSKSGRWSTSGQHGWVWDSPSGTARILDALVRKGLVTKTLAGGVYAVSDRGRAELLDHALKIDQEAS